MKTANHQGLMIFRLTALPFLALAASILLSGCGLMSTRIEARDERVFLPSFRAGMNLNDGKNPASDLQSGHAFEIGIAKAKGQSSQTLTGGQDPITFGNTSFTAPVTLQNEFDLGFGDISWRMRKFFDDRALGIEVMAGVGFSSLDLTISSPSQLASHQLYSRGPQAGFGLIWRFDQSASIQARIGGFASSNNEGVNGLSRYELSYTKAFLDNVSLRLGYAVWDVYGQTPNYGSDFRIRFSGPVLALNWDFNVNNRKIKAGKDE